MSWLETAIDRIIFGERRHELRPFPYFSILAVLLLVIFPLGYAAFTGHIWEDFFITYKFSENLAQGKGLVFGNDLRVHGFTSPIGTLLPAISHLASASSSYEPAIWIYRTAFCIPAYVLACICLLRIVSLSPQSDKLSVILAFALFLFEGKSLIFSVNGMETSFMLLAISLCFYSVCNFKSSSSFLIGFSWSLLMWTRPDGFIFIGAVLLGFVLCNLTDFRPPFIRKIVASSAICAVLYLPWTLWTWHYYGSPIPHTIAAKGLNLQNQNLIDTILSTLSKLPYCLSWTFAPPYPHFGGWPGPLIFSCGIIGGICAFLWILLDLGKTSRSASLAFLFSAFYIAFMRFPYPWYFPPLALLGIIAICSGKTGDAITRFFGIRSPLLSHCIPLAAFLLSLFILPNIVRQIYYQQKIVENGNRMEIGKWLKSNMKSDESLYLECLGYIGYFSGSSHVFDYPGLASPRVVQIRAAGADNFADVAEKLMPDWIVARPQELDQLAGKKKINDHYRIKHVFDAGRNLESMPEIYGKPYLLYDSKFSILKKEKDSPNDKPD